MPLDRFTQKAQEAVVTAQETAQRLQSPLLDAEHLLSALVEPDDGIPAETLRRLGVSANEAYGLAAVSVNGLRSPGRCWPGYARNSGIDYLAVQTTCC